jgi:hypothetical protein
MNERAGSTVCRECGYYHKGSTCGATTHVHDWDAPKDDGRTHCLECKEDGLTCLGCGEPFATEVGRQCRCP